MHATRAFVLHVTAMQARYAATIDRYIDACDRTQWRAILQWWSDGASVTSASSVATRTRVEFALENMSRTEDAQVLLVFRRRGGDDTSELESKDAASAPCGRVKSRSLGVWRGTSPLLAVQSATPRSALCEGTRTRTHYVVRTHTNTSRTLRVNIHYRHTPRCLTEEPVVVEWWCPESRFHEHIVADAKFNTPRPSSPKNTTPRTARRRAPAKPDP